jgi:hypothetical protein
MNWNTWKAFEPIDENEDRFNDLASKTTSEPTNIWTSFVKISNILSGITVQVRGNVTCSRDEYPENTKFLVSSLSKKTTPINVFSQIYITWTLTNDKRLNENTTYSPAFSNWSLT